MSRPFRFCSAASAIVLASMIAGCAAPEKLGLGGRTDGDVGLATRAQIALNAKDIPTAVDLAERAVAKSPDDAGFRALLGNAYFAAGRFHSAEAAYKDSLTLYSNQPQLVIKLALADIAQGKNGEAVAFLNAAGSALDPANYGLALALAGQPDDAVAVLEPAAREPGADARVRQNLALAYAFQGDWTTARTIASQDVPADKLDARIQQWMQLAKPSRPGEQVAAIVGVKPAPVDQGQPVRLALRSPENQVMQVAQAAPAPAPAVTPLAAPGSAEPQVAELAPAQAPEPQAVEAVMPIAPQAQPAPEPAPAPVVAEAPAQPSGPLTLIAAAAEKAASVIKSVIAPAEPAPKPARVRHAAAPARVQRGDSNAVMQLGSYRSPDQVTMGWNHLTQRYPALRAYLPMRARFDSANGTYWRLSVQGFDSQREAIARCEQLKGRGGKCFVRGFAGDKPVQIASR